MKIENLNNDTAKEFLTILSYCEPTFLKNIPENILKVLTDLAADSPKEFYIDKKKSLEEQNISDDCKNLLGIMYFTCISDSSSQEEILNQWSKNESENKIN